MHGTHNEGRGVRAAALASLVLLALAACGGGDYPVDASAEQASLAAAAAGQAGPDTGPATIGITARAADAAASAAGPPTSPRNPSAGEDAAEGGQAQAGAEADGPRGDEAIDSDAGSARRPNPGA